MDPQQPNTNQQYQASNPQDGFTPTEPPKAKKSGLMIGILVAAVIVVGILAFAWTGTGKNDTKNESTGDNTSTSENSSKVSDKFQKYDVTDKPSGNTFSVSFYKGATVEEKNGRTFLLSGEEGSQYSVYLGVATGDKIDCGEAPMTTMKLGGSSTTVCYKSDNTQYAGYAKAKSGLVKVNLAGQKAISMDDAKAILESVVFN